jgi:hypothetical protein
LLIRDPFTRADFIPIARASPWIQWSKPKADKNQPKTHVSAYKAAQDQAKPSFNPFAKKT